MRACFIYLALLLFPLVASAAALAEDIGPIGGPGGPPVTVTPEPGSLLLFAAGAVPFGLAAIRRRVRR